MSTTLTHRIDGEGDPLILLNGGLMAIPSWEPAVQALAADYRIIRCDFRGQLLSPGTAPSSLEGHVDDVIQLLDHLGIHDVHVFGASFGGEVGLLLAARHPGRVRSVVILTATDRITPDMRRSSGELIDLARAAADGGDGGAVFHALAPNTFSEHWLAGQDPDFVEQRAAQIRQLPSTYFEGLTGLMRALEAMDLSADLPRIESPTLIIGAELDRVFPVEHSRALAEAIAGAELKIIEGSGHGAVVEAFDDVIALTRKFHHGLRRESNA